MSTFNIPKKVCDKMDAITRRFWWKQKEKEGKFLALKTWDKHCVPKAAGSLGFRKFKDINNALLAKLAWMVASKQDSLCMQILLAKYKVDHSWLRSNPSKSASPIWKAIDKAKSIIIKEACYTMEDEASIDVWQDP